MSPEEDAEYLDAVEHLDEIVNNSIKVEEHSDYKKGEDGECRPENGYNDSVLMHRFMEAITVDGKPY